MSIVRQAKRNIGHIAREDALSEETFIFWFGLELSSSTMQLGPSPDTKSLSDLVRYLDLDGTLQSLALLLLSGICLGTHDTSTPVTFRLLVLVGVSLLDRGQQFRQLRLVFAAHFCQSENSGSLQYVELAFFS